MIEQAPFGDYASCEKCIRFSGKPADIKGVSLELVLTRHPPIHVSFGAVH